MFPADNRLIRHALDDEYKDLSKMSYNNIMNGVSGQVSAYDDKKDTEESTTPNIEIEKDAEVIKLKDRISELNRQAKETEQPKLIAVTQKDKQAILNAERPHFVVQDNYIWRIFDHEPLPEEWKQVLNELGFD